MQVFRHDEGKRGTFTRSSSPTQKIADEQRWEKLFESKATEKQQFIREKAPKAVQKIP